MASRKDKDEFMLLSKVRTGLKREFAFALKAQSEICGSLGRTRSRNPENEAYTNSANKRLRYSGVRTRSGRGIEGRKREDELHVENKRSRKGRNRRRAETPDRDREIIIPDISASVTPSPDGANCISEEEPKSDIVDAISDDKHKSCSVESIDEDCATKAILEEELNGNVVESISSNGIDCPMQVSENGGKIKDGAIEELVVENTMENLTFEVEGKNEGTSKDENVPRISATDDNNDSADAKIFQRGSVEGQEINAMNSSNQLCTDVTPRRYHLKKFHTRLKDFLGTGILEGMPVTYIRGARVRAPNEGLYGVIKGSGILCYCASCMGSQVITPNQFEMHAGSANKRPPEYIYLENGRTLRDVLNACKDTPLDELEARLKSIIGCSTLLKSSTCLSCRGLMDEALPQSGALLCKSCLELNETRVPTVLPTETIYKSPDSYPSFKPSNNATNNVTKISSARPKIQGRLTKKDVRLHKIVFEEDVLPDGTEVAYYVRGQKLLVGYKKGLGIFCTCCNSEVSPSQFEAHAGWSSRRKPYLHIYTSNGVSLHELSVSLSRSRKFAVNENDDLCSICSDGGDLLCCDGCPRAFHKECICLPDVPQDTWYCKYCETMFQNEKFAQHNANAVAAGRVAGIDPIEQITKRCIRIAKTPGSEFGGCVLCRGHGFSKAGFGPETVILCDQCEKEYHVGCLRKHNMEDLKELPEGTWFCCTSCNSMNSTLHSFVARGESELSESRLDVIKKKHGNSHDNETTPNLAISWRLLRGKLVSDETRALLSRAVSIFHEQFDPILESGTNKDFIPHMVYGRDMRDQEFGNMFCAVLTVNSLVVTAALFRIFGEHVAELPLVATSSDFRARGYFQCLFSCIEGLLGSLNVRNLVLPAADEAESIWTNKFGFRRLTLDEFNDYRKDHPMIMTFQGTSMLHKNIPKNPVSEYP